MKRTIALTVAALMMLGVLAGTAAAENKVYIIEPNLGNATVSKTPFFTDNENCTVNAPIGPGIGIPGVTGVKKGYWRITGPLIGVDLNAADLVACGKLNPVARQATGGVGAACGMSKGYDGKGTIVDNTKGYTIHITNLVWKTTEAGAIVAIGHVTWSGGKEAKGAGKIIANVNAQGAQACATKTAAPAPTAKHQNKSGGANSFTVNGAAEIIQGALADETPKYNDMPTSPKGADDNPAFCKRASPTACPIYGPKKQH